MIKVKEIYNYLNKIAPFETSMSFDNTGLLVGNMEDVVENVVVTLDITKEVIDEATKCNANLIISHHPVIFEGIKNIEFNSVVAMLIKNNINAIAVHTNLDIADLGVNYHLAKSLDLENVELVEKVEKCISKGTLSKPMTEVEFATKVKEKLNCKGVRFTNINKMISTVLVACGAGGDAVYDASKYKADALVTGEIKHHQILFAVENGVAVFDAGHYKSEDVVINPLVNMLENEFKEVKFIKSKRFTDTIDYI